MTPRDHNKLLSIFYFILAGLQLVGGLFFAIIYAGIGAFAFSASNRPDDQTGGAIILIVAVIIGVVSLAIGLFTLFTAFKVKNVQPIGRTLAIVISILSLFSIPIGTALGIYGLWFFFGDMGKSLYAGSTGSPNPRQPPSPGTWQ